MYDLIIIGSGPAGLTAGLYAGRFRLNVLIIEKINAGGQIILSPAIENFPGFPGGITTEELIDRFRKQVDELGVPLVIDEVKEMLVDSKQAIPVYSLKTSAGKVYESKCLIISSGAYPKNLGVTGEEKFIGRGVSYCGTCDAPLFKNKDILVLGGGDRAVEEAIFLAGYAKKVTLVHRRNQLRASKILEEKAMRQAKISFMLDSVIEEIAGNTKVESVKIKNVVTGNVSAHPCDGVFIFVGIMPNTGFVKNLLKLDEAEFIITDDNMKTSMDGVYACGDCRKKSLYQVINACGEGAVAASSVHRYLLNIGE